MQHLTAWFRREDYPRIREIMDDGDKFPAEFDEWEKGARNQISDAARTGVILEKVIIDPDDFVAFCKVKKLSPNDDARAKFVIARWTPARAQ